MSVGFDLKFGEMSLAAHMACMQRGGALKKGVKPKYGAPDIENSWEFNIFGCMGEIAVARYTNLFWNGNLFDFETPDVGGLIDVRATHHVNGRLRLVEKDKDDRPYVHTIVRPPRVTLIGWLYAKEGKREEWLLDPTGGDRNAPAYFCDNKALRSIESLLDWVKDVERSL